MCFNPVLSCDNVNHREFYKIASIKDGKLHSPFKLTACNNKNTILKNDYVAEKEEFYSHVFPDIACARLFLSLQEKYSWRLDKNLELILIPVSCSGNMRFGYHTCGVATVIVEKLLFCRYSFGDIYNYDNDKWNFKRRKMLMDFV